MAAVVIGLAILSALFLTALCRGWIVHPVASPDGEGAKNFMLAIQMPGLDFYRENAVERAAVYAQERAELVLKWAVILLAGNVTVWLVGGPWDGLMLPLGISAAVLTWGLQSLAPIRRVREYIGHGVEIREVERHPGHHGYRDKEIAKMQPPAYGGLFAGHNIGAGINRWETVSKMMLALIAPALAKFKETNMADPNPITPLPDIKHPDDFGTLSDDGGGSGQTTPPPPPKPPKPPKPTE